MTKPTTVFDDTELRDNSNIAVLDIGSNSFHLVVARVESGVVHVLHKNKLKVRLADGLDENMILSDAAIARGLEALKEIEQSLQNFELDAVRIVATYTIRNAQNAEDSIEPALKILSYPIEIICGEEEARMIYSGVINTTTINEPTLVIDIGGGSTEFVIGDGSDPLLAKSLNIGCVSFTNKYFADSEMTVGSFDKAIEAAKVHLELIKQVYISQSFNACIGTSGSVESMVSVVAQQSSTPHSGQQVTLADLHALKQMCIDVRYMNDLDLGEINEDRKHVFAAGLSILIAAFESLDIESIQFVSAALREGVIYDMLASNA